MAQKPPGTGVGPIGELGKEYNLTEIRNMTGDERPKDAKLVPVNQVLQETCKCLEHGFSGATMQHWSEVLRGYLMVRRLVFDYFGGHAYLLAVDRHPYAELIHTAVMAYLQNAHTLRQQVPAIANSIDDDRLRGLADHLAQLAALERDDQPITDGFQRLRANLEHLIYTDLQTIYQLAGSTANAHLTLRSGLAPLLDLFTRGGQESAESRKNNEKVTSATTDKVLGAVKKALDDAKKAPPADPARPAAPSLDLDAIKADLNRNRGSGRGEGK